jgi:hypothetical protein
MDRARAELDLAYRAEVTSAAEAQMRRAALHMERVRLAGAAAQPAPEQR